jgi:hypothetical protein
MVNAQETTSQVSKGGDGNSEQALINLRDAINIADRIFERCTGLREMERRKMAYYCASTYYPNQINPFPMLAIRESAGTGKTTLLRASNAICNKPVFFTASKTTEPVFRDKLAEACNGTAIIDEADKCAYEIEEILTLRYLRETALTAKKIQLPSEEGSGYEWVTQDIPIFGATILHRRNPFMDPAVDSRCIIIQTVPVSSRLFTKIEQLAQEFASFKSAMKAAQSVALPVEIVYLAHNNTMERIVDTYRPILRMVQLLKDKGFEDKLWHDLEVKSEVFKDGQSYEPASLLMQAVVSFCSKTSKLDCRKPLIVINLTDWVYENHRKNLNAYQAAELLREAGFKVKRSGGQNRLYIDGEMQLIRACQSLGIEDEIVERAFGEIGKEDDNPKPSLIRDAAK